MKKYSPVIASEAKQSQFLGLRLPRRCLQAGKYSLLAMIFIVFFILLYVLRIIRIFVRGIF